MWVKRGYLGVLTDALRRRGPRWGAAKLLKYLALRGALLFDRPWFGPLVAELSLTYRCHCSCKMCGLPGRQRTDRNPMQLADFTGLVRDLAGLGTEVISLGGGEPLLFEKLEDLVTAVSGLGLVCKLNTAGLPLSAARANDLVRAGLSAVAVSVDGAGPASHDALRGHPGAFAGAKKAVEWFARARQETGQRLRISTTTVLSARNLEEAAAIGDTLQSWPVDHIGLMPVQPSRGGEYRPCRPKQLRRTIAALAGTPRLDPSAAYLASLAGKNRRARCGAGLLTCVVDCYGDVFPCEAWYARGVAIGNIQDCDLATLWRGQRYREVRRRLRHCRECSWDCQMELNQLFGL